VGVGTPYIVQSKNADVACFSQFQRGLPMRQLPLSLLAPVVLAIAGLASVSIHAGAALGHPSRNFWPPLVKAPVASKSSLPIHYILDSKHPYLQKWYYVGHTLK